MAGFGGVAEYGITVRWNKNFLKVIRLLLERRARVRDVRRRALRRHAHRRQRLRAGLRPHRAVRRRRPADRHPDEERPRARRAPGVRLPDGAAAHRRGQDRFARQSAGPHADRGDRRRPDRHRHRHRIARLLPGAGGEIPQPLRDAGRGARRSRRPRRLDARGSRDRRPNSSRTPARFAPSARRPRARAASRSSSSCCANGAA